MITVKVTYTDGTTDRSPLPLDPSCKTHVVRLMASRAGKRVARVDCSRWV